MSGLLACHARANENGDLDMSTRVAFSKQKIISPPYPEALGDQRRSARKSFFTTGMFSTK